MKGSWSIKGILPTISPQLDYANLGEVSDGGSAQGAYLEMLSPDTPIPRRVQLIAALRAKFDLFLDELMFAATAIAAPSCSPSWPWKRHARHIVYDVARWSSRCG